MKYKIIEIDRSGNKYSVFATIENEIVTNAASVFLTISLKNTEKFLKMALEKDVYMEEHWSFIFGPMEESYDDAQLNADEVRMFYADTIEDIKQKEFYELCVLFCQSRLRAVEKYDLLTKGQVDDAWIDFVKNALIEFEKRYNEINLG